MPPPACPDIQIVPRHRRLLYALLAAGTPASLSQIAPNQVTEAPEFHSATVTWRSGPEARTAIPRPGHPATADLRRHPRRVAAQGQQSHPRLTHSDTSTILLTPSLPTRATTMTATATSTQLNPPPDAPKSIEEAVWVSPERLGGEPCFRDNRVSVYQLFEWLANGTTVDDFVHHLSVDRDSIDTVLLAAGKLFSETAKQQLCIEPPQRLTAAELRPRRPHSS